MFTGIIEELGEVVRWEPSGDAARLTVRGPIAVGDAVHGDSISVSGVCLTVVDRGEDWFTADVMAQTIAMSTLTAPAAGDLVNLERAAQVGDRLGGHIVQGHIDGTATLLSITEGGAWRVLRFSLDAAIAPLVTGKGSVAVDGVSLTVSDVGDDWFEVSLIPETLTATTLGRKTVGDRVNIETDILARHVERMLRLGVSAQPASATVPADAAMQAEATADAGGAVMSLADIPVALESLRAGRPIVVVDDEGRENEGDVVIAAQLASQEWLAWMVRHSSGFICAPMTNEIADRLELPLMVVRNEDIRGTAYTVSVDAADRASTGISASDRAHTLRILADVDSVPASLHRPGHILPLRARDGGVRERDGHTEAAVDLMKLAGLVPVAAISEIVNDEGEMMRLPGLIALGEAEGVPVITIASLIEYLQAWHCDRAVPVVPVPETSRVIFEVETTVPTEHGSFRIRAYRDRMTGADHLAIVSGHPTDGALVRVHSECLTGEVLGSLKCECGPQLDAALGMIEKEGGVVIYMRGHEGRGIGLINKLKAYRLQEDGLDTLDANLALGFPADGRDYGAAVAILSDLGIDEVRVITNNPDKLRQLGDRGVTVLDQVPLIVGLGEFNEAYLETKRDRMGHVIPDDATLDEAVASSAFRQSVREQEL